MSSIERHLEAWVSGYDSPNTRRAYQREARRWLAWCQASGIDPLCVDRATANIWRNVPNLAARLLAPATRARRLSSVASFYEYLVIEGELTASPFAHIKRPKRDTDYSATRGLTRDEANALLAASASHSAPAHAMICLLFLQGLRISEALAVRVEDMHDSRGVTLLTVTRKGGSTHDIPLTPRTLTAIQTAAVAGRVLGDMNYGTAYRQVQHLAREAGIAHPEGVTPHVCRHAFVTLALDAGASLRDVQDAVAHKDPRTTRRYDRTRGAVERHPGPALESYLAAAVER